MAVPFQAIAILGLLTFSLLACARGKPRSPDLENGTFTTDIGGFTIHYEVHGRGPVLMTVPNSWGLTLDGLRSMYRPLEDHVTMVYFDPRGMGKSGPARNDEDLGPDAVRADFEALRKHLGLEKVNVIGWSNGATNLVLLASEHPESFESAIFLHGNATLTDDDAKSITESHPEMVKAFGEFNRVMAESDFTAEERNARLKRFDIETRFPYLFADREAGKKTLAEIFRDTQFSWAHSEYTNRIFTFIDFRDRLPRIRARSLVIAGRHDLLPVEKAQEIASGIAGARLVVFERSGHFAPLEEREEFVRTVVDFLGATSGG